MTDYAANRPLAALDLSDPQAGRVQSPTSRVRPLVTVEPHSEPVDYGDRSADPAAPTGTPAIEQRLEAFIGLNCDAYLDYYRTVFSARSKNPLDHWHWVPFVFSTVWLFARRRYVTGLVLSSVPMLVHYVVPGGQAMAIAFGLVAAFCGFGGRPIYLALSLRRIAEIETRRLWPVQRDERLRRSGGVSLIAAAFGVALWSGAVALPFLDL